MNSNFVVEDLIPKIADLNISIPVNAFPKKVRQKVTFESTASPHLLNALRGSLLEYAKVKHLKVDEKSYVCTDKHLMSIIVFELVSMIIVDSNVPVGAQYKYSVKSTDGLMMLQAANFIPMTESGAIPGGFEQSTMFGQLFPGASIEFIAYVEEKMGMNELGKSPVKAVESTCCFYGDEELALFAQDHENDLIWEQRHQTAPSKYRFSFVHHGQANYKTIMKSAIDELIRQLDLIGKMATPDAFRRELVFGEDAKTGYEWLVYEPRPIACYLLQSQMATDKKFRFFALHDDYINGKIYFRLYYDGDLNALIDAIGKKVKSTIELVKTLI